ncbi:hypothetical protein M0805_009696 [Coniferiporia weirii]|nr:hypothetical protein M0805_009696 [Coniferiporia weirii]
MSARKTVKIDVISDFICAWCYVEQIELERGIALARKAELPLDFVVQFHPFILNPSLPFDTPVSKKEYYMQKKGDKFIEVTEMIQARMKKEGLKFTLDGNVRHTLKAHRLLQHAYNVGGQDIQSPLMRRVFHAYFGEGRDIGDVSVLAELATASGPGPESDTDLSSESSSVAAGKEKQADKSLFANMEDAQRWLEGDELSGVVRDASAKVAERGVTGVPFVVFNGRWAVGGCQQPECYFKIFEKLANTGELASCSSVNATPKADNMEITSCAISATPSAPAVAVTTH